jgi:hypothetical protein
MYNIARAKLYENMYDYESGKIDRAELRRRFAYTILVDYGISTLLPSLHPIIEVRPLIIAIMYIAEAPAAAPAPAQAPAGAAVAAPPWMGSAAAGGGGGGMHIESGAVAAAQAAAAQAAAAQAAAAQAALAKKPASSFYKGQLPKVPVKGTPFSNIKKLRAINPSAAKLAERLGYSAEKIRLALLYAELQETRKRASTRKLQPIGTVGAAAGSMQMTPASGGARRQRSTRRHRRRITRRQAAKTAAHRRRTIRKRK